MKNGQKYSIILVLSLALLLVTVLSAREPDVALPRFLVQSPYTGESEAVSIFDAEDGNYYVFLPSYANMDQVRVSLEGERQFFLSGLALSEGMNCSAFELETPYDFVVDNRKVGIFWFYKSANVATMYIDTATGNMERIHENKNYEENASLMLYTCDGKVDCLDENAIMKGRGNSTWVSPKRPYSLSLSSEYDLLNMGTASNWVLLANSFDETNLNNKLILDLASRVGLQWSPDSCWVDLYLNGEYNGLYLLTEKVEVHENRLNIDTDSGDFLCKIDNKGRWNTLRNPFLTAAGRTVEISYPEVLTESEQLEIESLVNQMEQLILSGTDLKSAAIIDLDSWVCRYLIDEISGNVDSDHLSSYFYWFNGKFYAGPVWDYDLTLGNNPRNQDPSSFVANIFQRSDMLYSLYHSALYTNESFYDQMIETYQTKFLPVLQDMIDDGVNRLSNVISKASQSNSIRWRSMFDALYNETSNTVRTSKDLLEYLSQRVCFLNNVWIERMEYCTIQFEMAPGAEYLKTAIPKGQCLTSVFVDLETSDWIDSETGSVVDFSQPIMTDMILSKQTTAPEKVSFATRDYIAFLSIVFFLILFAGFGVIDVTQRNKERRAADEQKRTEVSP